MAHGWTSPTTYHYHNVPSCLRNKATGASTVVGFAFDGIPIVVERDASGTLPTNANLDEWHSRTSDATRERLSRRDTGRQLRVNERLS